jgi:hypothetical protein
MQNDLSPAIKQFAAEHEAEIKAAVMLKMQEFFDSSISDNYHEKWDQGVEEHGPMTDDVLSLVNWMDEMAKEFKDAFWYQALILYRDRRG